MLVLTNSSANELYADVCRSLLSRGERVSPRGMPTTEVLGAHLCLTEPRRRFVSVPPERILNPAFAVAEALWILSGSDGPWIFTYNRSLSRYTDGGRLQGAYGPRMRRWRGEVDQLDHVRRLLLRDPDSRQAVIQLYDPSRDTNGHRDVPCTLNYRFFLRRGRLEMHTTMRSNDVWLGLPYDLFTATIVQELMASWLGVGLGSYHHHVDSIHVYAEHDEPAARIAALTPAPSPVMPKLAAPADRFTQFVSAVVAGAPRREAGPAWLAFADILASYRHWVNGERPTARACAESIEGELGEALRRWYEHLTVASLAGTPAMGGPR